LANRCCIPGMRAASMTCEFGNFMLYGTATQNLAAYVVETDGVAAE
jgi:hypothetical protein